MISKSHFKIFPACPAIAEVNGGRLGLRGGFEVACNVMEGYAI
jgi:hypothetical protein